MTDAEFLDLLEGCKLPAEQFNHAAHVRAGYLYLRAGGFAAALDRIGTAIRRHAAYIGKADKYHETVTVAYLTLIQQHISERGDSGDWIAFAQNNQELFSKDLLLHYYTRAQLDSALARKIFVLPHRSPRALSECD
jgi:hypothetical protein